MAASLQRCLHHETHVPAFMVEMTLCNIAAASAWAFRIVNSGEVQWWWKNSNYCEMARLWRAQGSFRERPHEQRDALSAPRSIPVPPPQPRHQTRKWSSSPWLLLQLHETTSRNHSARPSQHTGLGEIVVINCCFKLLSFGVCYVPTDNQNTKKKTHKDLLSLTQLLFSIFPL